MPCLQAARLTRVRVAMDGQIFAVRSTGISRMPVELTTSSFTTPTLASPQPSMVTRNHYLLSESHLAEHLRARRGGNTYPGLSRQTASRDAR